MITTKSVISLPQDVWGSTPHLGKGARCALPLHPSGHGSFRVLNPFQSQKTVSPINHSRETSLSLHPSILSGRSGAIAPLETHSQDLEKCLSTCTEPCTNGWPFDHQSGETSISHRYPHEDFIQTTSCRPTLRRLDATILPMMDHSHRLHHHRATPLVVQSFPPVRREKLSALSKVQWG